jgi:hypothetical protein
VKCESPMPSIDQAERQEPSRLDFWLELEKDGRCSLELNSLNSADTKSGQLSALESAVTISKDLISFRICSYEKKSRAGHATGTQP